MHIQSLLNLTDQELEDVMGAVEIWCRTADCAIDSAAGREALELAARKRRERVLSQSQLARLLSQELAKRT